MMNILAWTGYWVGLGIELFVIVVAGTLLVLMLTGVFEILLVKIKELIVKIDEWIKQKKEESAKKKAEKKAQAEAEAAAKAEAQADAEVAMTEEGDGEKPAEGENAEGEKPAEGDAEEDGKGKKKKKKKSKKDKEEEELLAEVASEENAEGETPADGENAEGEAAEDAEKPADEDDSKDKKKKKKGKKDKEEEEQVAEESDDSEGGEGETIIIQEGVVFGESKTITELYEELSAEQKGYFDELREAALAKPDAELAMAKNFVAVKIGKRNLVKLLIKRGVTVAEFLIENEAAKQLRLSSTNKRGKSTIKVKPTVVQVLDVPSLQVAIDMINLSYEEIMLAD